jgi:hypothetical protein
MKKMILLAVISCLALSSCLQTVPPPPTKNSIRKLKIGMQYHEAVCLIEPYIAHEFGMSIDGEYYHAIILQMQTGKVVESYEVTEVTQTDADGNTTTYSYSNVYAGLLMRMIFGSDCDDCETESYTEYHTEVSFDVTEYFIVFHDEQIYDCGYLYEYKRHRDQRINEMGYHMENYIR